MSDRRRVAGGMGKIITQGAEVKQTSEDEKEDVYDLPEGRVSIRWPAQLSDDSVCELKLWFDLVHRKMTRMGIPEAEETT